MFQRLICSRIAGMDHGDITFLRECCYRLPNCIMLSFIYSIFLPWFNPVGNRSSATGLGEKLRDIGRSHLD